MKRLNADQIQSLLQADLNTADVDYSDAFPGQSAHSFAAHQLNASIVKKFHNDETDAARDAAALQKFLDCNERCRQYGGILPRDSFEELVVGEMKRCLWRFFNPPHGFVAVARVDDFTLYRDREPFLLNLSDIAERFGMGPGAVVGTKATSLYAKTFCSTLTYTDPSLPILYRHGLSGKGELQHAEDLRDAKYKTRVVRGDVLSFAPKKLEISRTICKQPSLNMLFQMGIGNLMRERMEEVFNINLSVQPSVNAMMARRGSCGGQDCTIDLVSASDTISMRMLGELLDQLPEVFGWLKRTRSPSTVLPDGRIIELHMVSSMGNGFTFPLQTIIFAALVTAVYRCLDIPVISYGEDRNYSVFGDDIVVCRAAYNRVMSCLELLGFEPNRSKSFSEGHFRESCGSDYFEGHNVRGVYIQRLKTVGDIYSAINRLNRWSALHRTALPRLVGSLLGCLTSKEKSLLVPFDESDDAGIKVPLHIARSSKHVRLNRNGAWRYSALVPKPMEVRVPDEDQLRNMKQGWEERLTQKLGGFSYFPSALMCAVLAGWLRAGKLVLRPRGNLETELKGRVCPGWDSVIPSHVETREFRVAWKDYTEINLDVVLPLG